MKKIFLAVLFVALFLLGMVVFSDYCFDSLMSQYPKQWERFSLGDKRQVVYAKIGSPVDRNFWDIKGDIWSDEHNFYRYTQHVLYNKDTIAQAKYIFLSIGTKENFKTWLVRSQSIDN